ncbi:hypothetical protein FBUS_01402 [Fasciolopsis buskii]|uniref:EF-hand domain-containing protein n=1 Tax=Fasciolopsis buskii TaxID=27845 RepID=A0A8E0VED5_9TREM|nr:hypothetical protein FBUS_01402 [Fasciolopsis buski]
MDPKRTLERRFDYLDKDKDGFISREEYTLEITQCGLPLRLVEEFINTYEEDGDGRISRKEFISKMTKLDSIRRSMDLGT